MIRSCILTFILLLFLVPSKADYQPLSLPEMIIQAECIAYGTIQFTDDEFFTLEIENLVYGSMNEKQITVKRFVDFSCASRWAPYAPGQKVFLFLKKNTLNQWTILSDGGEGELPVEDDKIYISSWYGFDLEFKVCYRTDSKGLTHAYYYQAYDLYNAIYYGVEFELIEFVSAVQGLKQHCKYNEPEHKDACNCDFSSNQKYTELSELNKWLSEKAIELCP
jgi:hypothetical protein